MSESVHHDEQHSSLHCRECFCYDEQRSSFHTEVLSEQKTDSTRLFVETRHLLK